ncbi:MAG: OB-fold domain-containing protein [Chloroflexi bacterium]|nr:OB-fold domain-containing protein [Chloroflexota bacterium]
MTTGYKFLLPRPDLETKGWWGALRRHEMVLQRCTSCQTFRHPPQGTCPKCYSEDWEWVKMSGRGTIYSFIVVWQSVLPQWRRDTPYNVVQVTPEEAPNIRITGNVIDVDHSALKIGMPVEAVFDDVTPEDTILRWRLRG